MAWREPQPRTQRLRIGPLLHIQANFREEGLQRAGIQPRDGHQVYARQLIQPVACIIRGGIFAA